MTNNEALEMMESLQISKDCELIKTLDFKATVIKALEDLQQYRAMEEKLNGISVKEVVDGFISAVEKETCEGYEHGRILTNEDAEKWNAYIAIGTVEGYERAIETSKENYLLYAEYKSKLQAFESIGTIEEIKEKLSLLEKYEELGTVEELDEVLNMLC